MITFTLYLQLSCSHYKNFFLVSLGFSPVKMWEENVACPAQGEPHQGHAAEVNCFLFCVLTVVPAYYYTWISLKNSLFFPFWHEDYGPSVYTVVTWLSLYLYYPLSPVVAVNWLSSSWSFSYSAPPPGSGSRPVEHENQDRLDIKGWLWQPSDMEASSSD